MADDERQERIVQADADEHEARREAGEWPYGPLRGEWVTIVGSSNVVAVAWSYEGWDERVDGNVGRLYVRFTNGGIYAYDDVARAVYDDLLDAPSKGAFVARHLKGRYDTERLA